MTTYSTSIYSGSKYSGSSQVENCWDGEEEGPLVVVNVYDLADIGVCMDLSSVLLSLNEQTMSLWDMGIFHSGIVINGVEYSFGYCENGTGVYCCEPKSACGAVFRRSIPMGNAKYPSRFVDIQLVRMAEKWQGSSYSLLTKNCNHFCEQVCLTLGVPEPFPAWINGLAVSIANMSPWTSQPLVNAAKDHMAFRRPISGTRTPPLSSFSSFTAPSTVCAMPPKPRRRAKMNESKDYFSPQSRPEKHLPSSPSLHQSPSIQKDHQEVQIDVVSTRREVELLPTPKAWTPGFYKKNLHLSDDDGCEDEDENGDDDDEVFNSVFENATDYPQAEPASLINASSPCKSVYSRIISSTSPSLRKKSNNKAVVA
eukprot:CAMPEP_0197289084 /NCGR_PEP_ID=MMETSP0890-20130614/6285_1 /TAXON_ID=44058 ORGANISM="Aureoumbra lagunensis, Strain CCMP1510" /NCGR_SAMPLE_ID=MMETSP0890 /ASSEMBLY_ACC=CAM_ASM_000533 /LENGTH=367 /DNA_ID=CAMNT_0042760247 /DNA_START=38 /DNA_END=1141 /DNA_ORIENTATION=+